MSDEMNETPVEVSAPATLSDLKPKMKLTGTVKRLELYGAFIDVGLDVNALVHISKLGKERVNRVSDVLNEGDEVTVWVEKVDTAAQQIMVTMVEPLAVDWTDLKDGQVYTGRVNRLENFGAFVDIGAEREGLVHISELSHDYVKHPSEVYSVGDEVQVQVLGFSKRKRRIDLSIKALLEQPETAVETNYGGGAPKGRGRGRQEEVYEDFEMDEEEELPTAMEIALRKAMGDSAPASKPKARKQRKNKQKKYREQQEDILSRTLQVSHDG
ncbi:MAG: S1 RNA-binding domain-containing protein [Ardenticatenaceae bacterium]|nr:S1 RNA-binding domain-containing protein [Ardenticatenaceae bacterium]